MFVSYNEACNPPPLQCKQNLKVFMRNRGQFSVVSLISDISDYISQNFSDSEITERLQRRQYDPLIDGTILVGLVLDPYTALYRPFLKQCILPNMEVGTIWWALSKTPKMRQGPDLRPL